MFLMENLLLEGNVLCLVQTKRKKNLHVIVIGEAIGQTFRIFSKSKRISAVAYYTNFTLSLSCNGILVITCHSV